MRQPTEKQLKVLQEQPDETLIDWWNKMNCWGWPEGLPDAPQPVSEPVPVAEAAQQHEMAWPVMQWISCKVGMKAILRKHNSDMSDEEFESFWRSDKDPNSPYQIYRKRKLAEWERQRDARDDKVLAQSEILEDILDAEEIEVSDSWKNSHI